METAKHIKEPEKKPLYELTLAEFPITFLAKQVGKVRVIEVQDTIRGANKEIVKRIWRAIPSVGYGCHSTMLGTLFELFQIWSEDDFKSPVIRFGSIHNLIRRKFLKGRGKTVYNTIVRDLDALNHMTFDALNAYYDPKTKSYVTIKGLKIFDHAEIFTKEPYTEGRQQVLPFSYIQIHERFFNIIDHQHFFPLDVSRELFHNLTPLEQRLVLYLEKIFRNKNVYQRDIFKLAKQLPIEAKEGKYQKKHIKFTLKRACNGMMRKGYKKLERVVFEKSADRQSENIVFFRANSGGEKATKEPARLTPGRNEELEAQIEVVLEDMLEVLGDERSKDFYRLLAKRVLETEGSPELIYRALSETKEEDRVGNIKRSKGAFFTDLMKRYLNQYGISLRDNPPAA